MIIKRIGGAKRRNIKRRKKIKRRKPSRSQRPKVVTNKKKAKLDVVFHRVTRKNRTKEVCA